MKSNRESSNALPASVNIKWTKYAVDQFDALVDNLEEHRGREVALAVVQRLLQRLRKLPQLPRSAPMWIPAGEDTIRRLVVDDHVVLYRIAEEDNAIYILAVRHGRQQPLQAAVVPKS